MLKKIWDQGIPILIPLRDFLSTSTIHGLSHIASAKSLVVQILWLVIVSLGFGFAIHLISASYVEWMETPFSSVTTTQPISKLDFPEVTLCPPLGSNTALNQVLEQVDEEKQRVGLREDLKKFVRETFMESPSGIFATEFAHMMTMSSWDDLFQGTVTISHQKTSSGGGRQNVIGTSLPEGNFSTPGYNDTDYKGDFYRTSQMIHFHLDLASMSISEDESIVVKVETHNGVKWQHSKQDRKLKLYQEKKTFHEAESFCQKLGGHQASVGSEGRNEEVFKMTRGIKQSVWLGGTDEAEEYNWTWTDGTPWNYTRWMAGEPNNGKILPISAGKLWDENDCLMQQYFTTIAALDARWQDVPCSNRYPFICNVERKTKEGPGRIVVKKEELSSLHIWWWHNPKKDGQTESLPGIYISWENDKESSFNKKTDFLEASNPKLEVLRMPNITWDQAESICVSEGGHLVSITSQEEQGKVSDALIAHTNLLERGVTVFWLGGSDKEKEGDWRWTDGRTWKYKKWYFQDFPTHIEQPDGKQGENCLVWVWYLGQTGYWADGMCDWQLATGFVCRLPTPSSNLGDIVRLVRKSKTQKIEPEKIWREVLTQRWSVDTLRNTEQSSYCLDTNTEAKVITDINSKLNLTEGGGTETLEGEQDFQLVLQIFSLLRFCPTSHLVNAVKVGLFFQQLLDNHSMRTVVLTLMNMIKPGEIGRNENINLLYELFNKLDDEYDFQLGPTLLSLSSTSQIRQMSKLDLPYLREYKQMIMKCVERQDCVELDEVLQSPGMSMYLIFSFQNTFIFKVQGL